MGFNEEITAIADKIPQMIDRLETEEATKNALIMPFIQVLGYDVFNPREVVPEFVADVGTKKGEKVDYAIMQNGEIIILIECKQANSNLNDANISQLYRYFTVTKARIAILTNGVNYRFFSDLEEPNKMDQRPFLELDMNNIRENLLDEIKKLAKEKFDIDRMLSIAHELKYTSGIKKIMTSQFDSPDEDFVKYFFNAANPGARFVASAREQFVDYVKKAFQQFINESVSDRLRSALRKEDEKSEQKEVDNEVDMKGNLRKVGIVTTSEEIEGYYIVRAIMSKEISPNRIVYRDTKSYFGILLDDNNRKPICRLHFNTLQKYIGIFDNDKTETRYLLNEIIDIYKFSDELIKVADFYQ
ncbi:MAG TPA: restriction endonuclease [Candidatus Fraserbacteria bacterium]|nr:restriction endonuclease [Candidatus Fraserbacteria bacterium]